MINKQAVFVTLQVLKQCRTNLVQDFLENKPDIYKPSYRYEESPSMLKLAKDKYFITWLSSHWQVFNDFAKYVPSEERRIIDTFFASVFLELLSMRTTLKTTESSQLNLGLELIKDMQIALNQFMKAGENADMMRNMLEVTLEKNRVVFDRSIKQLSEENL
jgi:hypothetical protein